MIRGVASGGLAIASLLTGCSDHTAVTPPVITAEAVAATNGQGGTTSQALPHPLGVLVRVNGRPASGVRVTWSTTGGSVSPESTSTGPDGIAETSWVLGGTPGQLSASAAIVDGEIVVTFSATATPVVTMAIDPASNGQSGTVGDSLPMPIRVRVLSDGRPRASTAVAWDVAAGTIEPHSPVTDADGYATATWTMPTVVGTASGSVTIREPHGGTAAFMAIARPGAPWGWEFVKGDADEVRQLPANESLRDTIAVRFSDRFRNPTPGVETPWGVQGSGITLVWAETATDSAGLSHAAIAPTREAGEGVLHMVSVIPGEEIEVPFLIQYRVRFDPGLGFISEQNGSRPAIDTIPLDATMHWTLDPDDQGDHTLQAWTALTYLHLFPFPRAPQSISLSSPNPGVFGYSDVLTGLTGTVVVR